MRSKEPLQQQKNHWMNTRNKYNNVKLNTADDKTCWPFKQMLIIIMPSEKNENIKVYIKTVIHLPNTNCDCYQFSNIDKFNEMMKNCPSFHLLFACCVIVCARAMAD